MRQRWIGIRAGLGLWFVLSSCSATSAGGESVGASRPSWISKLPRRPGLLFGVGQGESVAMGQREAMAVLSSQLRATIQVETLDQLDETRVWSDSSDGVVAGVSSGRASAAQSIAVFVDASIRHAKVADSFCADGGPCHVLVSLDVASLAVEEAEFIAASEREVSTLAEKIAGNSIEFGALLEVLRVARQIGGYSPLTSSASRWRGVRSEVQRLESEARELVASSAVAASESTDERTLVCASSNGRRLVGAPLGLRVRTGHGRVPGRTNTDGRGCIDIDTGAFRGDGEVELAVTIGEGQARLFSAHGMRVPVRRVSVPAEALRVGLRLTGFDREREASLRGPLVAYLGRAEGLTVAGATIPEIEARLTVRSTSIRGQTTTSAEVRIDFGEVGSTRRGRFVGSAVGSDADSTTREAIEALVGRIVDAS